MDDMDRPELIALDKWLSSIGRSTVTAWRWKKKGWLDPVNISGRLYLRRSDINAFNERAQRGEFAKLIVPPCRKDAAP